MFLQKADLLRKKSRAQARVNFFFVGKPTVFFLGGGSPAGWQDGMFYTFSYNAHDM